MRTVKRHFLVTTLVVLGLLAVSGCAPQAAPPATTKAPTGSLTPALKVETSAAGQAAPQPTATATPIPATPTPKPVTLKYGTALPLSDIGLWTAIEKGYFKEEGITLDIVPYTSLSDQIPFVAKGDLDFATGGFAASIPNAVLRNVSVKVVADAGGFNGPGAMALAVTIRKDLYDEGKIRTAGDLKGKKVAVTTVQTMSKFFAPLMAGVGLTIKDLNFVPLAMPDTLAAYANKSIDAAFQMEPLLTQTVEQGLAVRWKAVSEYAPGMQTSVLLASPQFVQNKDVANRWMVAYLKGIRTYIQALDTGKGMDEIIDIAVKYTPVKDKALYQLMLKNGGWPRFNPDGRVNEQSLVRDQMQHFVDEGYIPSMPDPKSMIDNSLVDYAVEKLGKKT